MSKVVAVLSAEEKEAYNSLNEGDKNKLNQKVAQTYSGDIEAVS